MTLAVGDTVVKVDAEGKPVEGEMSREFVVLWLGGYGNKTNVVVLEEVK